MGKIYLPHPAVITKTIERNLADGFSEPKKNLKVKGKPTTLAKAKGKMGMAATVSKG